MSSRTPRQFLSLRCRAVAVRAVCAYLEASRPSQSIHQPRLAASKFPERRQSLGGEFLPRLDRVLAE